MADKCCNCPEDAVFRVADPGANPVEYCYACLPHHLRQRADLGHFEVLNQPGPEPVAEVEPEPEPEPEKKAPQTARRRSK